MAWIESHQELRHHPKLSAVCRTLSAKRSHMAGHLHFLWWWCMDYAMDGDLKKYTSAQIADAAEWEKDPEVFVTALVDAGFIDRVDDSFKIHDWMEFCGELIKKRLERKMAKRQKTADIVSRNPPKSAEIRRNAAYPTVPNRTVPNRTQPKTTTVRFEKPTAAQVMEYANSISFKLDGQHFLDYYDSKGWVVGRSQMKDWKATVRTWKQRRSENGYKNSNERNTREIGEVERADSKFAGIVKTIRVGD